MATSTTVDPYAGIATPETSEADPYAGIAVAEKPVNPFVKASQDWLSGVQQSIGKVANAPSFPEAALQGSAGAVKAGLDIPVEGAKALYGLLPQGIRKPIGQAAGVIASPVTGNKTFQDIVGQLGESYGAFKEEHPRAAENLGAAGEIAQVLPIGKGAQLVKKGVEEAAPIVGKNVQKLVDLFPKKEIVPQVAEKVSETIPDIEAVSESVTPQKIMSAKEVKRAVPKSPSTGIISRINKDESNLLAEPLGKQDTPFTDYALQARKAKSNMREMTPLDMAGTKGVQALKEIGAKKSAIGQQMDKLLAPIEQEHYATGTLLSTDQIKNQWSSAVKKYLGGAFDENGNIVEAEGRRITDPSESGLFKQLNTTISSLPQGVTIKELADTKTAIRRLTDNYKASMAQPINTTAEAAGKQVNSFIDNQIMSYAGPEYKKLSTDYANIFKIQTQLSKRLGEITDPNNNTSRMGASLMKSAVQSNSDRGTKSLFDAVKKVTGRDLVKEAGYAEIAMKAVGDPRVASLLENTEQLKQLMQGGIVQKLTKVAEAGYNKVKGDKLDELINFYNKKQKVRSLLNPIEMPKPEEGQLPFGNVPMGSGVNTTMPAMTRAGLGGVAGYTMTDPNATPEEKARNAMIGAAGGAFVPMLAKIAGKKVAGIPGAGSIENINNIKNSLSKRGIRGDNLLNEMDKLEEIKQGLGEVDKNGYVTLYHRTTPEAAKQIVNSGKMTSKEDGLFFSTKPTGQAEGYGDAVVKVKIPMEKLEVNDIFHDETHLRLPTNSINKMIPIGKAELWNPEINQMGGQ